MKSLVAEQRSLQGKFIRSGRRDRGSTRYESEWKKFRCKTEACFVRGRSTQNCSCTACPLGQVQTAKESRVSERHFVETAGRESLPHLQTSGACSFHNQPNRFSDLAEALPLIFNLPTSADRVSGEFATIVKNRKAVIQWRDQWRARFATCAVAGHQASYPRLARIGRIGRFGEVLSRVLAFKQTAGAGLLPKCPLSWTQSETSEGRAPAISMAGCLSRIPRADFVV